MGLGSAGKTCNYCAKCKYIVAHKHELEAELVYTFTPMRPDVIGNDYVVLGTIDRKHWKRGIEGSVSKDKVLDYAADFKRVGNLVIEPARCSSEHE